MGNEVHLNCSEEPSSDYVEHLESSEGLEPKESRLVTYHQLGASFITPVSTSEKHAHFQTKIIQMRYANRQHGEIASNARIEARANAVMEMILIFKKEEGEWKISGMAGSIKWIEFNKTKEFVGTNHPEKNPRRKKIVENALRYHRLLPGPKKETSSSSQQQLQLFTPRSSHGYGASFDPRSLSRGDEYPHLGHQGGYRANQRFPSHIR